MRSTLKIIQNLLRHDEALFHDANRLVDGPMEVVMAPTRDYQWQLGFLREDFPQRHPYELIENTFIFLNNRHTDAIALNAYRPASYFCMAVGWWDLFPVRTVSNAKRAIAYLKKALEIVKELETLNICIYSFTRAYGEMMPARTFVEHINKGLAMILEEAGADLYKRGDAEIIQPTRKDRARLLMTLNC
jgi:hypothetical protein